MVCVGAGYFSEQDGGASLRGYLTHIVNGSEPRNLDQARLPGITLPGSALNCLCSI